LRQYTVDIGAILRSVSHHFYPAMAKKRFGQSVAVSTQNAMRLIDAFQKHAEQGQTSLQQDWQFLQEHLKSLDESLLEALPLVFTRLTAHELPEMRQYFAQLFVAFGNLIQQSSQGNRRLNLELSISAYQLTLKILNREAFPEAWAGIQNNLGAAYGDRICGERSENIEQAIAAYELALQVYTREAFPEKWAKSQGNLAGALSQRATLTQNNTDLDQAIALLQAALEVDPPGSPSFINSQYHLGNALSWRYEYSQTPSDLQQALHAYQIALKAISPAHYDRQTIWQALPATQSILGSRLVRDGQWQEGLKLLLHSVRQLSTSNDRLAHANALFQVGRAHETLSDWDNARLYYRDALRLYEHLQDQPGITKSRAGLGGVLVSQGHLNKGMAELLQARKSYERLGQPDKAAAVDRVYQAAQQAMAQQAEVYA
jgi:tetratricopeptide (TPR) repeat protein